MPPWIHHWKGCRQAANKMFSVSLHLLQLPSDLGKKWSGHKTNTSLTSVANGKIFLSHGVSHGV